MTYARLKLRATEVSLAFPAVVVYDGTCALCLGGKRWIERRALPGEFEFLPCQSPERRARFPRMSEQTCLEAIQLVLPDGRVLAGDQAIPEILRRLGGWRWVAHLFELPGAGFLAPRLYRWVARNRYAISCAAGKRR
jgi:predicted DCC family thiol-disulfide oxidoreductase YuxK